MHGTVKWFNNRRGFGFITDSEGNDVFVHYSGIEKDGFKTLKTGNEVSFQTEQGPNGEQATGVKVI